MLKSSAREQAAPGLLLSPVALAVGSSRRENFGHVATYSILIFIFRDGPRTLPSFRDYADMIKQYLLCPQEDLEGLSD